VEEDGEDGGAKPRTAMAAKRGKARATTPADRSFVIAGISDSTFNYTMLYHQNMVEYDVEWPAPYGICMPRLSYDITKDTKSTRRAALPGKIENPNTP
jgi:hypothetical protein